MRSLKLRIWENRQSWQCLWKASCSESLDVQIMACGKEILASGRCTHQTASASRSSLNRQALLAVIFLGSKEVLPWYRSWLQCWSSQMADFQILQKRWAVFFRTGSLGWEGSNDFAICWDVARLPYEDCAGSQWKKNASNLRTVLLLLPAAFLWMPNTGFVLEVSSQKMEQLVVAPAIVSVAHLLASPHSFSWIQ